MKIHTIEVPLSSRQTDRRPKAGRTWNSNNRMRMRLIVLAIAELP